MKKLIYIIFLISGISVNAQVAINTDNTIPDPSSMLDVKSIDKGILMPRMTQAQRDAIITPAGGLMVYQTDNTPGLYYNSGTSASPMWVIAGSGYGWGLEGNSGTPSGTSFLGTTDDVGLAIKVNNQPAGKIDHLLFNTSWGYQSLALNTSGINNTANGQAALFSNTTGNNNTAYGAEALYNNTSGYRNTATGRYALYFNTVGLRNTAIGYSALYSNTAGNNNIAIGNNALYSNTSGSSNVAAGNAALYSNTTGYNNTANGQDALYSNTSGSNNTANGQDALYSNTTGSYNTAFGNEALYSNTIGNLNTAIGETSMYANTSGTSNTACGNYSGSITNNSYCSFFGYDADVSIGSPNLFNSTALGGYSTITSNNQVRIGSSTVTSIGGYAGWSNVGDKRFKTDVKENVPGLAFINQLKPVTYHLDVNGIRIFLGEDKTGEQSERGFHEKSPEYKSLTDNSVREKEQITYSGFIAQDVEKAAKNLGYEFSGVDKPQTESSLYGLRYAEFVVPLVKAVQEQQTIIDNQNKKIDELIKRIESLENK